jgi:hypothetical protein
MGASPYRSEAIKLIPHLLCPLPYFPQLTLRDEGKILLAEAHAE